MYVFFVVYEVVGEIDGRCAVKVEGLVYIKL